MMLDKLVQATVSSLGYLENGIYNAEPDCYAGVHDLIRYLHSDKETLDARRICLANNIVRNDLVPIMVAEDTNEDLFNIALRLTVNLCQPTIVAFGGKVPEADDIVQVFHDVETSLVNSLAAFTSPKIFEKFAILLKNFFSKEWTERQEADKTITDRIVILCRYIFAIGMECPLTTDMAKIDSMVKERVIRAFLSTELPTTLMAIGCDRMEKELSVHVMAIFSLLLRSIDCERVATFQRPKTVGELQQEEDELKTMVERERAILTAKRGQLTTSRSHLGAKYSMKNAALNPEKDLLVQNSFSNTPLDSLRPRKRNIGSTKRSRVRNVMESLFKPNKNAALDICLLLNTFCKELITNAFDRLMKATRETAFINNKSGGVLTYSDVNYFFLAEYVLQFIRLAKMPIEKAASIFSKDFFHHIISQCDTYFDMMKVDKFNITSFAVRAQHAISSYKEMMLLLNSLSKSGRDEDKKTFSYLTQTIYYNEEYREFGYLTLNKLHPQGMTRKLLEDLIVASHYYILTMDHIIKTGELQVVAKRKRILKKRKKNAKKLIEEVESQAKTDKMNDGELIELWDELLAQVQDVLDGKIEATVDISPLSSLLKVSDEQEQIFAALKIQRALRGRRICDAIGLYRGASDVWPDSTFGKFPSEAEEDIKYLKDIFNMDLSDIATNYDELVKSTCEADAAMPDRVEDEEHVSVSDNEQTGRESSLGNELEDSEDEERPKYKIAEINFDFNDYISHFTKPDIIHWYVFALKDYESNQDELNRAILKMFHRIAFQLNTPSRLYMATLFRIFTQVDAEIQKWPKEAAKKHRIYDIYKFGYHLLQKFFGHFKERGEILICELLFPKTAKECVDIENGYGTYEEQQNSTTLLWTEELEEELQSLYNQYNSLDEKPEGINIIEFIQHNLSTERYPKQIQRQLKTMGLSIEKPKKERSKRKSKKINEDQLFASRTPSPANSEQSSDENNEDETPENQVDLVNKGIEGRLFEEESLFISQSQKIIDKDQKRVIEEEEIVYEERSELIATYSQSESQESLWPNLDFGLADDEDDSPQIDMSKFSIKKSTKSRSSKKTTDVSEVKKKRLSKKSSQLLQNIDEDSDDFQNENQNPTLRTPTSRRVIETDSDGDEGQFNFDENSQNLELLDNSQQPETTIRFIDSDEDDEVITLPTKRRQIIQDDEDE